MQVIPVCDGCVGRLHGTRLRELVLFRGHETSSDADAWRDHFEALFRAAPASLAEFKPTWGYVFRDLLHGGEYTHWTYTDADVVFGELDAWLGDRYDVETWAFEGDAGRVFARGQFALHRIVASSEDVVATLFAECDHLGSRVLENVKYKLDFVAAHGKAPSRRAKRRERAETDATRGTWNATADVAHQKRQGCSPPGPARFLSAEACYSCVLLDPAHNLSVGVLPVVFSDHDANPVVWRRRRGRLERCSSLGQGRAHTENNSSHCNQRLVSDSVSARTIKDDDDDDRSAVSSSSSSSGVAGPVAAKETRREKRAVVSPQRADRVDLVLDCTDMRWICRSSPRAAVHARFVDGAGLGPDQGVVVRGGAASLVAVSPPSSRRTRAAFDDNVFFSEAPAFHYRKWADYGRFDAPPIVSSDDPVAGFVVHESGFRVLASRDTPRRAGRRRRRRRRDGSDATFYGPTSITTNANLV